MVRSVVILGIVFLLALALVLCIGNAQVMSNPLSYPQNTDTQLIVSFVQADGSTFNQTVELGREYPVRMWDGITGSMEFSRTGITFIHPIVNGVGLRWVANYSPPVPWGQVSEYYVRIRYPVEPVSGGQIIYMYENGQMFHGNYWPGSLEERQQSHLYNLGRISTTAPYTPTVPSTPIQPINRAPPGREGQEFLPGITLPGISSEMYFVILFALIIGWLLVLRIARIGSILINVGGVEVILFIGTFLGWVSIFIGICLMILSIVPVLLEHSVGIASHMPQIGKKEGGEE